ncbi:MULTISPECIES: cupin-like domain-containing protein [Myxococcus]|uniref:cupin-like domain-containing protein n=1 Tax=Myxococcus TaxID=32 RepID=UPI001143621D|nr:MULTISPECIES: cupin-like domain-containing protein [Myxococcus]NOK00897.1 cupin-like domain-containing protein [Myxococcus xanthus]
MNTKHPIAIERISSPTPAFFREHYLEKRRPVVLTGVVSHWPAVTRWSADSFKQRFGDHRVVVERSRASVPSNDPLEFLRNRYYEEARLGDTIARMVSGEHPPGAYYVTYANIFDAAPELLGDFESPPQTWGIPPHYPRALQDRLTLRPGFWLGPAGTVSAVHFDRQENFNAQISGRKKWTLYSPQDSRHLYYPALDMPTVIFSPVDIEAPDARRFPRFAEAQPYETILEPGELLFIPAGWWHHVRTLELSISLNFWWWTLASVGTTARVNYHFARKQLLRILGRQGATAASMPVG